MRSTLLFTAAAAAFLPPAAFAQTVRAAYGGHTYIYYASPATFDQANAAAGALGGYLATVTSQGEQNFIHGLTPAEAWLGGSDRDSEGTWRWLGGSEAGKSFYSTTAAPVDLDYSFWAPGEPNDFTGFTSAGEDYLSFNRTADGRWNDFDQGAIGAGGPIGYVVEFDTLAGPVSATGTYGGHTYNYYATPLSFDDASAAAAQLGGYLATITSQGEQDVIHGLTAREAWVGGSDAQSEGTWRWLGGPEAGKSFYSTAGAPVDLGYSFWAAGEPNDFTGFVASGEDYLSINRDSAGRWNDFDEGGVGAGGPIGFIVEFAAPSGVPEPETWAMLLTGFGLIGGAMRRRAAAPVTA